MPYQPAAAIGAVVAGHTPVSSTSMQPAVVARLNAEINKAMEAPDVVAKFAEQGLTSRRNTPAEFGAYLRAEIPKWAKAVKDSGATVN